MTFEDIDRIAALAKLEFSRAEKERLLAELNATLAHIEILNGADTAGAEPLVRIDDAPTPLRADEVRPSTPLEAVLANAPDADGGLFRVPNILGGPSR
jgi:aspartyl-tRNA(Asn)/glutamyl-tRNA(Gln) amidotransferase subunit C